MDDGDWRRFSQNFQQLLYLFSHFPFNAAGQIWSSYCCFHWSLLMTSLRLLIPTNPPLAPKLFSPFLAAGAWIWRGSRIFWRSRSIVLMPWMKTINIQWWLTNHSPAWSCCTSPRPICASSPSCGRASASACPLRQGRDIPGASRWSRRNCNLMRSSAIDIRSVSYKNKFWHLSLLKYFWHFIVAWQLAIW